GLSFFFPINFSALTGIPGLPNFTALQAFDPTLRTSDQRSFLLFLSAALPTAAPGFPKGLNLANLSLPLAYIQGFGDTRLNGSVKQFSTFFQDDIRLKSNLIVKAGLRYDISRASFMPTNN